MFQIALVVGTSRPGNYTSQAVKVAADFITNSGHQAVIVSLGEYRLQFPGMTDGNPDDIKRLQESLRNADGVILSTPEYHGSFSAILKLMFENLGFPSALKGKPVGLLGVAAGRIGAIKSLEQLRSVCSHVGALVLPQPVSVAGVQSVFDEKGNCTDIGTQKAIESLSKNLIDYLNDRLCPDASLESLSRNNG